MQLSTAEFLESIRKGFEWFEKISYDSKRVCMIRKGFDSIWEWFLPEQWMQLSTAKFLESIRFGLPSRANCFQFKRLTCFSYTKKEVQFLPSCKIYKEMPKRIDKRTEFLNHEQNSISIEVMILCYMLLIKKKKRLFVVFVLAHSRFKF